MLSDFSFVHAVLALLLLALGVVLVWSVVRLILGGIGGIGALTTAARKRRRPHVDGRRQ